MSSLSISRFFVSALLLCASSNVFALIPDLPYQTSTSDELFDPRGVSPRPTEPPKYRSREIFARQNFPIFPDDAEKVLVAPDNICGYVSGLQGAPYSCGTDYKCLFFSATGGGYGPIACCTSAMSCAIRTACVGSAEFYGSQSDSACDGGCQLDLYTLKCTESSEGYCGVIRFTSPNIQDFWCVSTKGASWHIAQTNFVNQTQLRVFATVDKSNLWPISTSKLDSTKSASKSAAKESSTTSHGNTDASSTNTTTPTPAPVGAIVGGVLGAVALISLVGFGAFFVWRRFRRNDQHQKLSGGITSPDPYRSPTELDTERNSYSMTPSSEYVRGEGVYQQYDDPNKPQELYTPSIASGAKTAGQYTQVPADDQGGYIPQQTKPLELESRQDGMTPIIGTPYHFPAGEGS